MKYIYRIFKTQLLMAVVLFGASIGFAQNGLVQVPSNCNVIDVGLGTVGGVTGLGGKVGPNGIVGMADPSPGGIFTFIAPVGSTLNPGTTWKLLGDLSSINPTATYGTPTQPANGTTATIFSYNKKERPSESVNYTLARSKGRVSASYTYTIGQCTYSGAVTFDIFKTFPTAPQIVGPACIDLGFPVTYSVDQVASDNAGDAIGFDSYYWSGLNAVAIATNSKYYSADNSSITFTPTSLPAGTVLQCCIGKLNANIIPSGPGPDPTATLPTPTLYSNCVTKPLNVLPQKPVLSIANLCVDTSVNSVPLTFNTSLPTNPIFVSTYTYSWSNVGNLWTITGTPGNWVFNKNGDNNPGILTLIINNNAGCLPVTFTYEIKRSLVAVVTPFFGIIGSNCIGQGAAASNYALSPVANLNAVTWTSSPKGLTLTAGTGAQANTVNIVAPTTQPAGRYTLTATSASPCAGSISYIIDVVPPYPSFTTPFTNPIGTSPSCVVRNSGSNLTFSCAPFTVASPGVASYLWGLPAGWSVAAIAGNTNPSTTNSIILTPGGSETASVISVIYRVSNGGVISGCQTVKNGFAVNYNPVAPTGVTLTGCFTAGLLGTKTLTINNPQNFGTYKVTSTPAGLIGAAAATIAIVGTTDTITFPTTGATGTYTITVTHNGVLPALPAAQVPICGTASSTPTASFTVAATTAAWATNFPSYDTSAGGSDVYRVNAQPTGTTYQWFHGPATITNLSQLIAFPLPNANANAVYSPSGNSLTLYGAIALPLTSTNVYCIVTPGGGGCPIAINAPKGTHGISNRGSNLASGTIKNSIELITVYPNPNNGAFNIKLDKDSVNAKATLYDINGKEIGIYALKKGENKVEKTGFSSGSYNLVLELDGQTETRQVIIK